MNSKKKTPLNTSKIIQKLIDCSDMNLSEIHDEQLRDKAISMVSPKHWDKLTAAERRREVKSPIDNDHSEKFEDAFLSECKNFKIRDEINRLEHIETSTLADYTKRDKELKKLHASIDTAPGVKKRKDAMSIEIDTIIQGLREEKQEPTPNLVWTKLCQRCGTENTCCAAWELKTSEEKSQPVILWFGATGNKAQLTFSSLKERMRRIKRR